MCSCMGEGLMVGQNTYMPHKMPSAHLYIQKLGKVGMYRNHSLNTAVDRSRV